MDNRAPPCHHALILEIIEIIRVCLFMDIKFHHIEIVSHPSRSFWFLPDCYALSWYVQLVQYVFYARFQVVLYLWWMETLLRCCKIPNCYVQDSMVWVSVPPVCPGYFLGIGLIVFSKFWHGVRKSYIVLRDMARFFGNFFCLKMGKSCQR